MYVSAIFGDIFEFNKSLKLIRNLTGLNLFCKHSIPEGLLYRSLFSFKTFLLLKTEFATLRTEVYNVADRIRLGRGLPLKTVFVKIIIKSYTKIAVTARELRLDASRPSFIKLQAVFLIYA